MAQPTIADLACYEEIAQLPWANLFDVSGYPHASAWLERMSALPHHEAMHRYNSTLGDIASTPNTMERMMSAIGAGLAGLGEAGFQLEPS